jgi:hypothetical protein
MPRCYVVAMNKNLRRWVEKEGQLRDCSQPILGRKGSGKYIFTLKNTIVLFIKLLFFILPERQVVKVKASFFVITLVEDVMRNKILDLIKSFFIHILESFFVNLDLDSLKN